jgi:hypothetical protein
MHLMGARSSEPHYWLELFPGEALEGCEFEPLGEVAPVVLGAFPPDVLPEPGLTVEFGPPELPGAFIPGDEPAPPGPAPPGPPPAPAAPPAPPPPAPPPPPPPPAARAMFGAITLVRKSTVTNLVASFRFITYSV